MTSAETASGTNPQRYQEPGTLDVRYEPIEDTEAIRDWLENGYRVRRIINRLISFEKLQEGVLRYPPVQVQVARDPEYIQAYINMEPTKDWSKLIPPIPKIT